jgi:hypothetical protein
VFSSRRVEFYFSNDDSQESLHVKVLASVLQPYFHVFGHIAMEVFSRAVLLWDHVLQSNPDSVLLAPDVPLVRTLISVAGVCC